MAGIPGRTGGVHVACAATKAGSIGVFHARIGGITGASFRRFTGKAEVTELGDADVLPVAAAAYEATFPALWAGFIAGLGAHLLAHMKGTYAREAIIVAIARLTEASLTRITGRGLTCIRLNVGRRCIRLARIGLGRIRLSRVRVANIWLGRIHHCGRIRSRSIDFIGRDTAVGATHEKRGQR